MIEEDKNYFREETSNGFGPKLCYDTNCDKVIVAKKADAQPFSKSAYVPSFTTPVYYCKGVTDRSCDVFFCSACYFKRFNKVADNEKQTHRQRRPRASRNA